MTTHTPEEDAQRPNFSGLAEAFRKFNEANREGFERLGAGFASLLRGVQVSAELAEAAAKAQGAEARMRREARG